MKFSKKFKNKIMDFHESTERTPLPFLSPPPPPTLPGEGRRVGGMDRLNKN